MILYCFQSPLDLLSGLGLNKLGIGGDAHILGKHTIEDQERAFACVGMMEI